LLRAEFSPAAIFGTVFHRSNSLLGHHQDPQLGWGELVTSELEVFRIPGGHREMFLEPNVAVTAEILTARLVGLQARTNWLFNDAEVGGVSST